MLGHVRNLDQDLDAVSVISVTWHIFVYLIIRSANSVLYLQYLFVYVVVRDCTPFHTWLLRYTLSFQAMVTSK
jgi:hypothetical protein